MSQTVFLDFNRACDKIIELGIATEDEIQLVTNINGMTKKALNDIVQVRKGYRTLEQYIESECTEEFEND